MGMFLLRPSNSDIVNLCAAKDKSKITQISEHDIHEEPLCRCGKESFSDQVWNDEHSPIQLRAGDPLEEVSWMEKPEHTRASAAELATKTIDNHNLRDLSVFQQ
jgi:hypothetical protein